MSEKRAAAPTCLHVLDVRFASAPPVERRSGLLGWVSFTIEPGLRVDGVAVRRTRSGRHTLSFPFRRDQYGIVHYLVEPVGRSVHREIERQVFEALGLEQAW